MRLPGERARARLLVGGVLGGLAAALLLRNLFLLRTPVYEYGDQAANSILVNEAVHGTLLVGNYSRARFNHPGPAFLYVQAAGQQVFYAFTHAVPARYNGQVLGAVLLNAVLLAVAALVVGRRAGGVPSGLAFVLVCLAVTASQLRWADTWMPYLYAAPFLLALVAGSSVASGRLGDLPWFVLAGGFLVHGHIAFVPIVGVFSLLVTVGFVVRCRRSGQRARAALRDGRRPLAASGAVAGLFLLPIVLELALHWPGPWPQYWRYATSRALRHGHSLSAVLHFLGRYLPHSWWGRAALAASAAAAVGLVATEQHAGRRRYLATLLGSCAAATLLFVAFVVRGVDALTPVDAYLGFFYFTVPATVAATAVVAGGARLAGWLGRAGGRRRWLRPAGAAVAAAAALATAVFVVTSSSFVSPIRGDPGLPRLTAEVAAARPAGTSTVVVDLPSERPLAAGWVEVTGLLVTASRAGDRFCVHNPWWTFMMTARYICPTGNHGALRVLVLPLHERAPRGWTPLAADSTMTVYTAS